MARESFNVLKKYLQVGFVCIGTNSLLVEQQIKSCYGELYNIVLDIQLIIKSI